MADTFFSSFGSLPQIVSVCVSHLFCALLFAAAPAASAIINANLVFVERVRSPWIYPCDNSVLAIFNRGATEPEQSCTAQLANLEWLKEKCRLFTICLCVYSWILWLLYWLRVNGIDELGERESEEGPISVTAEQEQQCIIIDSSFLRVGNKINFLCFG